MDQYRNKIIKIINILADNTTEKKIKNKQKTAIKMVDFTNNVNDHIK